MNFGNDFTRYDTSEMSQGKIGYFGISYKGEGEPPVTPRLIQYDQPTGATILTTEAQYQTRYKVFWWQVTGANVDYTSGGSIVEPNGLRILIPGDAEHSDTIHNGGWLRVWNNNELEIITV